MKNLSLYGSLSYNRFYFAQDIDNASGGKVSVDGQQVPGAPKFLAKGIVSYTIGDFTLSPSVKYFFERYGDVLHRERIDDAVIYDFDLSYATTLPRFKIKKAVSKPVADNFFCWPFFRRQPNL